MKAFWFCYGLMQHVMDFSCPVSKSFVKKLSGLALMIISVLIRVDTFFFSIFRITKRYLVVLLFSRSLVSNCLQLCGLQHARLPCPSLSPGVCSNSGPLSQWCHPTLSSSIVPFSSFPQPFLASGSFLMN